MWRKDPASAPAPPQPTGELLASFERDEGRTEIRYSLDEFKSRKYVSIRAWALGEGGFWPTKVGTTIRGRELRTVIQALEQAIEKIEAEQGVATSETQKSRPHPTQQNRGPARRAEPPQAGRRDDQPPSAARPPWEGPKDADSASFGGERPRYVERSRRPGPRDPNAPVPPMPVPDDRPFDETFP
jgi:hypothetical protein